MFDIVKYKRIPFVISAIFFLVSAGLLASLGLKPSIDFTGGTVIEIAFTGERPAREAVEDHLATLEERMGKITVQPVNEDGFLLKMPFITEEQHQDILSHVRAEFAPEDVAPEEVAIPIDIGNGQTVEAVGVSAEAAEKYAAVEQKVLEKRIETIGASISSQLQKKSWQIGVTVVLAIILFVAYAFRKVTRPVSSWKYGVTAIIALIHDVTITMGVFALLGHFMGIEVGIPFVVAMLTILGYSVNDTIVVFDRIREKLLRRGSDRFAETVAQGVCETIPRSINTSVTTLLVLTALFLFGGESIRYFALALIIGIGLGTYSSIFLASPLLVVWERMGKK